MLKMVFMLNISDDKPCEYLAECQGATSLFLHWERGGLAERRTGAGIYSWHVHGNHPILFHVLPFTNACPAGNGNDCLSHQVTRYANMSPDKPSKQK